MCGIVCYKGSLNAKDVIVEGLTRLEYRGYDSSGLALINDGKISLYKEKGGLDKLKEVIDPLNLKANLGIGHIRWATHGKASKENAHPHLSNNGKIAVVHNGIIENYKLIKEELAKEGYIFKSETDTELVAILLEKYYEGDILKALVRVKDILKGAYALGIITSDQPDRLLAIRNDSPLVLGVMDDGFILASDSPSFSNFTKDVVYIENGEIVDIKGDTYTIYDENLNEVKREINSLDYTHGDASKNDYDFFMLKEIEEQAKVIRTLIDEYIDKDKFILKEDIFSKEEIEKISNIYIVACGTAYNAGLVGKYIIEKLAKKPVTVELASEFAYKDNFIDENSLIIILSQSGETADSLKALRMAKDLKAKSLAITNVAHSSIDRQADRTIYCLAGPEVAVASTKAYTSMLFNLYLLAINFGINSGKLDNNRASLIFEAMMSLPSKIENIIDKKDKLKEFAENIKEDNNLFYLARGLDYPVSIEAALKLKEVSYIHTEAFAAGELKHGTIALVEYNTPIIAIISQEELLEKILSNIEEVKARKAKTFIITNSDDKRIDQVGDFVFRFDKIDEILSPILSVVPTQLIAYYTSILKGLNVDKPRNLAKSVTVE